MANQIPYLDVQNLTKSFGADVLFRDISFSIAEGQKVGLIARNGTGKSTLLSILTDREGYDSGSIVYRRDLRVGYLEQTPAFDPEESVLDACFNHQGEPERLLRAKQILTQLHINDMEQPMGQLSGGQQKGAYQPPRSGHDRMAGELSGTGKQDAAHGDPRSLFPRQGVQSHP